MFKNTPRLVAFLTATMLLATQSLVVFSQSLKLASFTTVGSATVPTNTAATSPEAVVAQFIAAEAKVRDALNQHTFKRDVVLQTIGPNGEVTGEYIRNSQFVFDNNGRRIERVVFHPKSTISEMRITKEDIQDLAGAQLLGIDISENSKYNLTYVGMEPIESQQLIALDVTPRMAPDPNHMSDRFFVGRVWLDPNTYQIVKIRGVVEPQGKQRFPLFETWRSTVKGPLAFPVRTEADDVLHFRGRDVHYRIKVRYYDYQLFASRVSITEVDDDATEVDSPTQPPAKTVPPPAKNDKAPNKSTPPQTLKNSSAPSRGVSPPKEVSCQTNREAPPVGPYHWPADSMVKVYFTRGSFTYEQRAAALEAMATWSNSSSDITSGVTFVDAGETDSRQTCQGCLTIRRNEVFKQDRHHYAFFYPMNRADRFLVSAWIDLDVGIQKPEALKSFLVHELGHGLGLWDCTSCKNKQTIMNAFPGLNKDNGLREPSRCDLATVRGVYQEERFVARTMPRATNSIAGNANTAATASGAAAQDANSSAAKRQIAFAHVVGQKTTTPAAPTAPLSQNNQQLPTQSRPSSTIFDLQHWNFSEFAGWRARRF